MDKQILFCHCKSDLLSEITEKQIASLLDNATMSIIHLHDLCGLCVEQKETVNDTIRNNASLLIACHSRTLKSLLAFAGIEASEVAIKNLNARELSYEEIEKEVAAFTADTNTEHNESDLICESEWPSWYPVIDYNRGVGCGQCADFCLFGTYSKTDTEVNVANPQSCKNNCPACARICPHTAIIFPKYKQGGIISGNDNINEAEELERRRNDVNEILGNDIYKALAQRKAKRQRIIQNEVMKTALNEREEALKAIKNTNTFNPFGNIKPL
jgi:NAD-dependent dihydropyrimidine dehydrogenase PreA subunit